MANVTIAVYINKKTLPKKGFLYSERDLNPHEHCCSLDFKSSVSTNFTIRALLFHFCFIFRKNELKCFIRAILFHFCFIFRKNELKCFIRALLFHFCFIFRKNELKCFIRAILFHFCFIFRKKTY